MAPEIGGIEGVLGDLVSEEKPLRESPPKKRSRPQIPDKRAEQGRSTKPPFSERPEGERAVARRGRPPGRKSGEGPFKEKATFWVNAGLIADYRDWSWEQRCNVGELIEQALVEHRRRHRKPPHGTRGTINA